MSIDIGPRIGLDGEADFRKSLANINQQIKTLGSEMKVVTSAFDANDKSQESLAAQNQVLTRQIGAQEQALAQLRQGLIAATVELGETDTKTLRWQQSVNKATAELNQMKAQLAANERAMDGLDGATGDVADAMDKAGNAAERSEGKFSAATVAIGSLMASAIQTAVSALGNLVSSLVNLDEATEEYRIAQGKLNTAFEAAGFAPETAKQAYTEFYKILGDTDTATEASQLLAKLATSEEDVATWTEIAAGVSGTFGDSLPIESLIEAANETAKVGQVTGTLADALNWAGINEDDFNSRLAAAGSEAERNKLIMDTLSGTYDQASDAFYRNNAALVSARKNQAALDAAMSGLGTTIGNIKTQILSQLVPSLSQLASAFNSLLTGAPGAQQAIQQAISGMVRTLVMQLPSFLSGFAQISASLVSGLTEGLTTASPQLLTSGTALVTNVIQGITQAIPQVLSGGLNIVTTLLQGVTEALPQIAGAATAIMSELGSYLQENLPSLLETGFQAVTSFTESLRENAGVVVDGAIELAKSLAQGLADSIPIIIENVPTIVSNIANTINDNAPKILATAVDIIKTLVQGLISAIPTIIQNIPKIIGAIVDTILAFNWLNLGKQVITGLGNGLKSMASFIKDATNSIVNTIKDGIKGLPSQLLNIGKDIVRGLLNGIKSMGSWLKDQITGFCTGVLDGFLSFFGIASPSRLMRDKVGVMLSRGVAVGIDDGLKYVNQATRNMASELERGIKRVNQSVISMQNDLQNQVSKGSLKAINGFRSIGVAMASGIGSGFGNQIRQVSRSIDRSMAELGSQSIPVSATSGSAMSGRSSSGTVFANSIASAVREGLHGAAVYLNGQKVGYLITRAQNKTTVARGKSQLYL